jgi:signal transduction histidine kinase
VQPHAWRRYLWLWDGYFAATAALSLIALLIEPRPTPVRAMAALLVTGLVVWYAALGRPMLTSEAPWRRRLAYQVGVLVMFAPAAALADASTFLLFALVPQAMMVWSLPVGVVVLLALVATSVLAPAVGTREVVPLSALPGLGILVAFTIVVSVYLRRIARQSAERADLVAQLAASRAEVARLSHREGVAAERQRLAGEIHDTIAQGLSSVVMLVQSAEAALERDPAAAREHLGLARRTARDNLAEARALVAALTPAALDGSSLDEALHRLSGRGGTPTTVSITGDPRTLPTPVEVVLLRAAQEALSNVDKHAGAGAAQVRLCYGAEEATLEIADDGAGFRPGSPGGGYGLTGMRARVGQVGGTVAVDSAPGAGTTVRVTVPAYGTGQAAA